MGITGTTFDKAPVPSNRDSILFDRLILDVSQVIKGRRNEMSIHTSGLTATVDTGLAIVQGRLIEITSPETIAIPANSNGYISLTIDLSKSNPTTGTPFKDDYKFTLAQAKIEFVTILIDKDTNEDNPIYTFNLASVISSSSTISVTKNELAYRNYINAYDGVFTGSNPKSPESILENEKWSRGKPGSLKVATLDTGLQIVNYNDDSSFMPVTASTFKTPNDTDGWIEFTIQNNFKQYGQGQMFRYKSKGETVNISGAISPTRTLSNSGLPEYVIAYIPQQYAPSQMVTTLAQGSYNTTSLITVWPDGRITASRLRNGANTVDFQKDNWISVNIYYML